MFICTPRFRERLGSRMLWPKIGTVMTDKQKSDYYYNHAYINQWHRIRKTDIYQLMVFLQEVIHRPIQLLHVVWPCASYPLESYYLQYLGWQLSWQLYTHAMDQTLINIKKKVYMLYFYTVELPNKGHIGGSFNLYLAVLSFAEKLLSSFGGSCSIRNNH